MFWDPDKVKEEYRHPKADKVAEEGRILEVYADEWGGVLLKTQYGAPFLISRPDRPKPAATPKNKVLECVAWARYDTEDILGTPIKDMPALIRAVRRLPEEFMVPVHPSVLDWWRKSAREIATFLVAQFIFWEFHIGGDRLHNEVPDEAWVRLGPEQMQGLVAEFLNLGDDYNSNFEFMSQLYSELAV